MNKPQALNTIFKSEAEDWEAYQANEVALDRAMEYALDGRL